ncbi:restriction endonuclease subunit S [Segatella copri]|jgi:type I restriction enzyme S subunit|uniref:restriction endonuclease subunit S n=1 Tax=Segatella copri TaxID=165179 RepID=UPI001291B552|nr:restriction endonuclease subunit S [Segatella copri]MQM73889.1 restriction endonuclease subunit S [Segatella copri]
MATYKEQNKLNVPHLRFPKFYGEWCVSTIGEQFDLYSGNTPSRLNKEHFDGNVNWITSGELKEHYISDTKEKISEDAATANNLKLLHPGTFVIAIYGLEADGVRGTGSITCKESTISQACMAFTQKGDVKNEFLYSWYKKHGNIIGIKYAQGTKQQNLSYDILEKFHIAYPSQDEQDKLIQFISLLDERIATQSKLIEDLKKLKSAIIDYAINSHDTDFAKFGSLYETAGEGGTPTTSNASFYDNGKIPFIKIDDLKKKYLTKNKDFITELGLQKSSAWLVPTRSILFSNGATIGEITITTYPVCTKQGILGIVPKPNIDVEFLYYFMSSSYFKKAVSRIVTEGTMKTVYLKDINNIRCPIPTKEKQLDIAKMPSALNSKIDFEQSILKLFGSQKQYLLRQMFM